MTREDLIEVMAEAIAKEGAEGCPCPQSCAAAVLVAIETAGITLVPSEPDSKMVLHAGMALGQMSRDGTFQTARPYERLKSQWNAMLDASPFATQPATGEKSE